MKIVTDAQDRFWELVSVIFLAFIAGLIAFSLPSLPEIVPIHFNSQGEANGYGSKYTLWLPFICAAFFYALMTLLSMHPELYRSRMTNKNVEEQKILTSKMIRVCKASILLFFVALTLFVIKGAQGEWTQYYPVLIVILIVCLSPGLIYYLKKFSKIR